MWQLNHERLSDAIQKGTGIDIAKTNFNSSEFELFANLTQDAATFSAFKNHEEQAKLFALLKGDDGKIRTFSQFKKVAMPLAEQYNINWLKTEHNAAINNSLMAKKMAGFSGECRFVPEPGIPAQRQPKRKAGTHGTRWFGFANERPQMA